ncbi:MAG: hypothetical protein KJ833_03690 [Alphaproteobacteria bacterium]|nr:hypothetical protein [Alphaproteobacteria bacterium]
MSRSLPVDVLRSLLEGHDLDVSVYNDWCLVAGGYPAFTLTHVPPEPGRHHGRLVAKVQLDQARRVALVFAAIGEGDEGFAHALKAFVTTAFHVFLTAFCGADCCNQTDTEIVTIGDKQWRVTNGPLFFRFGDAGRPSIPEGFWASVVSALQHEPDLSTVTHWVSLYFARVQGSNTVEALLDNETWLGGAATMEKIQWPDWPGFYSVRVFAVIQPI